jgi:hypothetical protein
MTPVEANALLDIARKSSEHPGLEHIRDAALRALREGTLYTVSKGSVEENDEPAPKSRSKAHASEK